MMPFDLVTKTKKIGLSVARIVPRLLILSGFYLASPTLISSAQAKIDIGALGGQSTMAEQGAICASFAALMENQILINQNLGNLWSERRKFSGAVVRRAVELAGKETPTGDEIDVLINDYREWLLLNLSNQDSDENIADYQTDVQNLIKTNCASLFLQADKAIMKRFPDLAYLVTDSQPVQPDNSQKPDNSREIESLLAKNQELNLQIDALNAEIATLKTNQISAALAARSADKKATKTAVQDKAVPEKAVPKAPDRRPTPPAKTRDEPSDQITTSEKRFFAQLGSYSSEEIAITALADLKSNFEALFNGTDLNIKPHAFDSGKIFYRVRTTTGSRATITKICDTLWQSRMGCLIKTIVD